MTLSSITAQYTARGHKLPLWKKVRSLGVSESGECIKLAIFTSPKSTVYDRAEYKFG